MDGDPFGRDDSDVAASASATATATPAAAPGAATPEPRAGARPSAADRQLARERVDRLLLLVFVVATFGVLGALLASEEHTASSAPAVKAAKSAEDRLDGKRLFDAPALQAALDLAHQRNPGTTVNSLDVRPDRIDMEIRDTPGKQFTVDVRASQGVSTSDFGTTRDAGVPWDSIDTTAPARIERVLARRFSADPGQIDYMVFALADGRRSIITFVKTAGPSDNYTTDLHGRHMTKGTS